jgi:hypothetical protein
MPDMPDNPAHAAKRACAHRGDAVCRSAQETDGVTDLAPYIYPPHDPMGLFIPRLQPRACHRYPEVESILAGQRHAPVVYFARVGSHVKIGTTTNLTVRMRSFYLGLDDVLAVVPGDKHVEDLYHHRFGRSQVPGERPELFRRDLWLRLYLARCRCSWAEFAGALGIGAAVALSFLPAWDGVTLGLLAFSIFMAYLLGRTGWEWR